MQKIVDSLLKQGKIYKKMQEIAPKELGIRNKIKIYKAVDLQGYFWVIFAVSQKTKLFVKDVKKMEEIYYKLTLYCDHNFKNKLIFIDAPLCTNAKKAFFELGWKIR